jgi:hypothetical protein
MDVQIDLVERENSEMRDKIKVYECEESANTLSLILQDNSSVISKSPSLTNGLVP